MSMININEEFTCEHCLKDNPKGQKTPRNHCMHCLYSKHVDDKIPGDRKSNCENLMIPESLNQKHAKYIIIHKCLKCDKQIPNKAAIDDNFEQIISLSKNNYN